MNILLGFDPGGKEGKGKFGWCVAEHSAQWPIRIRRTGIAKHAQEAVDTALSFVTAEDTVLAAAIDAPLFWVAAGVRIADQLVRDRLRKVGGNPNSVLHVNALRGACLVQGILAGLLLRERHPGLALTETHPKAYLWMSGIASHRRPTVMVKLKHIASLVAPDGKAVSEDERDAAISTLSAWAMVKRADTWTNIYPGEEHTHSPLAQPLAYWIPKPTNRRVAPLKGVKGRVS